MNKLTAQDTSGDGVHFVQSRVTVHEIRPERLRVAEFPGYAKVTVSKTRLDIIVKENIDSWRGALSNVAGGTVKLSGIPAISRRKQPVVEPRINNLRPARWLPYYSQTVNLTVPIRSHFAVGVRGCDQESKLCRIVHVGCARETRTKGRGAIARIHLDNGIG